MSKLYEYISVDQLQGDIENLEHILDQQVMLKQRLKGEIRNLKFKDRPPIPPMQEVKRRKEKKIDEPVEATVTETYEDLDDLLQYMCGEEGTNIAEDLMDSMIRNVIPSELMGDVKHAKTAEKDISGEGFFEESEDKLIGLKLSDEIISETLKDIMTDTEETQSETEKPTRDYPEEELLKLLEGTKLDVIESGESKSTLEEEPTHEGESDKLLEELHLTGEKEGKSFDTEAGKESLIHGKEEELIAEDVKSESQSQEGIRQDDIKYTLDAEVNREKPSHEDIVEVPKEESISESENIRDLDKVSEKEGISESTHQDVIEEAPKLEGIVEVAELEFTNKAQEQDITSEVPDQEQTGENTEHGLIVETKNEGDSSKLSETSKDEILEGVTTGEEASQIEVERESAIMDLQVEEGN